MNLQDDLRGKDPLELIPRWFEMLKELRNGTISYIQLIKREQIRPPVRPVCRRLGVAKLSDIVSEDILYRAVVQVAEAQSRGVKMKPEDGRTNPHDLLGGMSDSITPGTGGMHGMPYGRESRMSLDSIGAVGAHIQSALNPRGSRMSFDSTMYSQHHHQYDDDGFFDDQGGFIDAQTRFLPQQPKLPGPPKRANFYDLLNAILTVKASNGRVKRMSKLTEETGISEDTLVLAVQRVCNILGCYRLDPNTSNDAIMRALKLFVDSLPPEEQQQMYNGGGGGQSPSGIHGAPFGGPAGGPIGVPNDPFGRGVFGGGIVGGGGGAGGFIPPPARRGDESPKPPSNRPPLFMGSIQGMPGNVLPLPGGGVVSGARGNMGSFGGANGQQVLGQGQPHQGPAGVGGVQSGVVSGRGQPPMIVGGNNNLGASSSSGRGGMYPPPNVTLIEDTQQQEANKRMQQQQRLEYLSSQQPGGVVVGGGGMLQPLSSQQQQLQLQQARFVVGGGGMSAIQQQQRLDNLKRRSLDSVLQPPPAVGMGGYATAYSSVRTGTPMMGGGNLPMPLPVPRQIGRPGTAGQQGSPVLTSSPSPGQQQQLGADYNNGGGGGSGMHHSQQQQQQQNLGAVTVIASGKTFWDLAYELLTLSCDTTKPSDEAIGKLFELVNIVESCGTQTPPTAMSLVLDIVVERALRILTDRGSPSNSSSSSSSALFVALIDDCITLLMNTVNPLLQRFSAGLNSRCEYLFKILQAYRGFCVSDGQKTVGSVGDHRQGTVAGEEESESIAFEVEPASSAAGVLPPLDGVSWGENGDAVLTEIAQRQQGSPGWPDVVEHIRFRLELVLETNQPGSSVAAHNSSALNLLDSAGEVELVAVFPDVDKSTDSLRLVRCDTLTRLYELELQLSSSVVSETAVAVLREVIQDARAAITTHVNRIKKAVANSAITNDKDALAGAYLLAPHLDRRWTYDSPGVGAGATADAAAGNLLASMNGADSAGDSPQATISRQLAKLSADAELLCKIGERLSDSLARSIETARRSHDAIAIYTQLATMRSQVGKSIYDEGNSRKNVLSFLEGLLTRSGYSVVGVSAGFGRSAAPYANALAAPPSLTTQSSLSSLISPSSPGCSDLWASDVDVIHIIDDDAPVGPTPCSIAVSAAMCVHRSSLLKSFIQTDNTGKVRDFIALVGAFTRVHCLTSSGSDSGSLVRVQQTIAPDGQLSTYTWTVIVLHFLLKFQYLPNILGRNQAAAAATGAEEQQQCGGVEVAFVSVDDGQQTDTAAAERLAGVSLLQLLHAFFKYLAFEVDVSGCVLTLRGAGEVLPKSVWGRGRAAGWRLSVEDPFERWDSRRPTDLGSTLTRESQVDIFKAARRASFATHALLQLTSEEALRQVPALFTRSLLLGLAKAGGYVGSIIYPISLARSEPPPPPPASGSGSGVDSGVSNKIQSEKDDRQRHIDEYLQQQQHQNSAFMVYAQQSPSVSRGSDNDQQQFRFSNSDRRQQLLNNRKPTTGYNSDFEDGSEGQQQEGGNFDDIVGFPPPRTLESSNSSYSSNSNSSGSRSSSYNRLVMGGGGGDHQNNQQQQQRPDEDHFSAVSKQQAGNIGGGVIGSGGGAFNDFSSLGNSLLEVQTIKVLGGSVGGSRSGAHTPTELFSPDHVFTVESLAPAGILPSLAVLGAGTGNHAAADDMWNGFHNSNSDHNSSVGSPARRLSPTSVQAVSLGNGDDGRLALWTNNSNNNSSSTAGDDQQKLQYLLQQQGFSNVPGYPQR